jgi:hypothetical protein
LSRADKDTILRLVRVAVSDIIVAIKLEAVMETYRTFDQLRSRKSTPMILAQ